MVDLWARQTGNDQDDVVAFNIAPEPSPPPGTTKDAASPIRLRVTLKDASIDEAAICGGVSREPVCSAQPRETPE
jgi:hypothetical protein